MLTTAQLATLRTDIAADPTLNAKGLDPDSAQAIADAYNALAAPNYFVWRTNVPVNDILDHILWANYTPTDVPDGTVTWSNRSLSCQGKQFNLELMLVGRSTIDASRANIRSGLNDATSNLPSGVSGAIQGGGAAAILLVLSRQATRGEKLFATGTGTQGSPATMGFEGLITGNDVTNARAN